MFFLEPDVNELIALLLSTKLLTLKQNIDMPSSSLFNTCSFFASSLIIFFGSSIGATRFDVVAVVDDLIKGEAETRYVNPLLEVAAKYGHQQSDEFSGEGDSGFFF